MYQKRFASVFGERSTNSRPFGFHHKQTMTTMLMTDAAVNNTFAWPEWRRKLALRYAMQAWVTENDCAVLDMCVELERSYACPRA
jgi:hypothetical protein